jgi:hypothetical protein
MLQKLIAVIFVLHLYYFIKKVKINLDYYELIVDLRNNRN